MHVTLTVLVGRLAASTIMQVESPKMKVTSMIPKFAVLTAIFALKPHTNGVYNSKRELEL